MSWCRVTSCKLCDAGKDVLAATNRMLAMPNSDQFARSLDGMCELHLALLSQCLGVAEWPGYSAAGPDG